MAEKKTAADKEKKPAAEKKATTRRKATAAATATTIPKEPGQKQYEAMFLFPPPGTTDADGMAALARGIIERHGGTILHLKKWDERKLSYEIKRQKRGTYIIAYYKGPGPSVAAIERDVNLSEEILRVLITDATHLNQKEMEAVEPQPIQPREERAPWDRPDFNRPMRPGSDRDRPPRREEGAPAGAEAGAGYDKD
ncbi:MAG: small subunit ribosomal protein [Phycisphaerales bacterium]|jgi:ribosomal protein S6|nr:small subunit ribosomal protein [Phycisphaerales bacterium]